MANLIQRLEKVNGEIQARVESTEGDDFYQVTVRNTSGRTLECECTCQDNRVGWCKHICAVLRILLPTTHQKYRDARFPLSISPLEQKLQALFNASPQSVEVPWHMEEADLPAYPFLCLHSSDTPSTDHNFLVPTPLTAPFDEVVTSRMMLEEGSGKPYHLDATRFHSHHPDWDKKIQEIASRIGVKFGVNETKHGPIRVLPYHMIVCNKKAPVLSVPELPVDPNRFAVLQVQLPSIYTGGETTWSIPEDKQTGSKQSFELPGGGGPSWSPPLLCAYLPELQREDKPLTSGVRVVILYGLICEGFVGSLDRLVQQTQPFRDLVAQYQGEEVIFPLSKRYSESEIEQGMACLKGKDEALVRPLSNALAEWKKEEGKPGMKLYLMHCNHTIHYSQDGLSGGYATGYGYHQRPKWSVDSVEDEFITVDLQGGAFKADFPLPPAFEWKEDTVCESPDFSPSDSEEEEGATSRCHSATFLVITYDRTPLQIEALKLGILGLIKRFSCQINKTSTLTTQERIDLFLTLVNGGILPTKIKDTSDSYRGWKIMSQMVQSIGDPALARQWIGIASRPAVVLSVWKTIAPLLSLWDDAELLTIVGNVWNLLSTSSMVSRVIALYLSLVPADPTPQQQSQLATWADQCVNYLQQNAHVRRQARKDPNLCSQVVQLCAHSSSPVTHMEAMQAHLLDASSTSLMISAFDKGVLAIPEGKERFVDFRRKFFQTLISSIPPEREEKYIPYVYYLQELRSFPDRDVIAAPLFERILTPKVDGGSRQQILNECELNEYQRGQEVALLQYTVLQQRYGSATATPWHMPLAQVEPSLQHENVQAFLHGPERSLTLQGCFGNIYEAREYKLKGTGFTASVSACGAGKKAAVTITKEESYYTREKALIPKITCSLEEISTRYPHVVVLYHSGHGSFPPAPYLPHPSGVHHHASSSSPTDSFPQLPMKRETEEPPSHEQPTKMQKTENVIDLSLPSP